MRKAVPFALALVCCISLQAQSQSTTFTDRNSGEQYAAYLLRVAYYDRGYMGAQVNVSRSGQLDLFAVTAGPVYHFKAVSIEGLPPKSTALVLQGMPKEGDVYSAGKVNDWLSRVGESLKAGGSTATIVRRETKLNHSDATVRVVVKFQQSGAPHLP